MKFTIGCYPLTCVSYSNPNHPRHAFPEDWDNSDHPRFAFERIQGAIEQLATKGYTVDADSRGFTIRDPRGVVAFQMEIK